MRTELKIVLIALLAILVAGCAGNKFQPQPEKVCPVCEVCQECEECPVAEEKALVASQFVSWGENIENSNEILYDVLVINYGFVEAKNVVITCNAEDKNGNKVQVETKNIGSIGSASYVFKEITSKKTMKGSADSLMGLCTVKSCENCENLDSRLPEE